MRSKMPVQRGHPFYYLARRQRNAHNWLGHMLPHIDTALTWLGRIMGAILLPSP